MGRRGRSGKWLLAEIVNGGLVLLLVLCAFWVDEPEEGTILVPAGAEYLVLATPLALIAFIGVVARPVAGLLDLLLGVLALVSGFRGSSLTILAVGVLLLFVGGLFVVDAVERDFERSPASAPPPPGEASPGSDSRKRIGAGARSRTGKTPSPSRARVHAVELAGLPVPSESVIDLVRRLRAADLAATAETLELALATGETMPGASSPDRFALVVPDREALLRVLDEECPAELTELMSLLRADHEWRVRRGIWVDPRSRSGVGDT
jgi:hypothetical protein